VHGRPPFYDCTFAQRAPDWQFGVVYPIWKGVAQR
jgi:hypothetical protein